MKEEGKELDKVIIINNDSHFTVENWINDNIKKGYKLRGDLIVTCIQGYDLVNRNDHIKSAMLYTQVMVLDEDN